MMLRKVLTISALLLLVQTMNQVVVSPAYAQVKKCQDAQGKWHYGNDLRGVCKSEANIQSVKERVKTPASASSDNPSERELTRLELKVLNLTEYLTSDLKTILAPYSSEQDIENRFERLTEKATTELSAKEEMLAGLQKKQQVLESDKASNPEKSQVLLVDNNRRIRGPYFGNEALASVD